jgi:hypothetical protein
MEHCDRTWSSDWTGSIQDGRVASGELREDEGDKDIPTTFHARTADDGRGGCDRQHGGHCVLDVVCVVCVVVVVVAAVVAVAGVAIVVNEVGCDGCGERGREIRMRKGRDSERLRAGALISD